MRNKEERTCTEDPKDMSSSQDSSLNYIFGIINPISQMRKLRFREAAEIMYLAKGAIRKRVYVFLKSVKRKTKITTTLRINEF